MSLYSKKGDSGQTSLPNGGSLSKGQPIFEFLGTLDELNCLIGLSRAQTSSLTADINSQLDQIQNQLFSIGADVANNNLSDKLNTDLKKTTEEFEKSIDRWGEELPKLNNFILPGGSNAGASWHQARTVARRAERTMYRCHFGQSHEISTWLNRLSDYLFQLARFVNFQQKKIEKNWNS